LVPVIALDFRLQLFGAADLGHGLRAIGANGDLVATWGQKPASLLLVAHASVTKRGINVGLVAATDELGVVEHFAAILDARIAADDHVLRSQLEIGRLPPFPD